MESQRILVNGVHIGVTLYGEPYEQQQILVLLHGFTGSAANWARVCRRLAGSAPEAGGTPDARAGATGKGMQLIALDMLGHGQSDAPTDPARYSIEHCQADILAGLETLGVRSGEAILLGYSMGGRIALYTAFAGFFRALILESASEGFAVSAEREQRRQSDNALAARIEREGVAAFVNYWEQLPLFASQNSLPLETRAALRAQRLNNSATGLANSLRGVGTGVQPALHEQLSTLTLPTLLLAGELDNKFCQIARQMAAHMPQANLRIVPSVGHTIHLEQPDVFARLVHEFCSTVCYIQ